MGYRRSTAQLTELGYQIVAYTVWKIAHDLRHRSRTSLRGPSWTEFLRAHARDPCKITNSQDEITELLGFESERQACE